MLDFGKYAGPVLWSYGSFLVFVLGFLYLSVKQRQRARAELDDLEKTK